MKMFNPIDKRQLDHEFLADRLDQIIETNYPYFVQEVRDNINDFLEDNINEMNRFITSGDEHEQEYLENELKKKLLNEYELRLERK